MKAQWPWLAVLLLLFFGGVVGGWALSSSHGTSAANPARQQRADSRLESRIRQAEGELAQARSGQAAALLGAPVNTKSRVSLLSGLTIVVDPGHNGGNASHPEQINRLVPAGANGTTKPCNTTGTETNDGQLTEAQFNLDVAEVLASKLRSVGAKVVMTRTNNDGVGPCVNERAEIANKAGADVAISIHADGNLSPGAHGFDVIYPATDEMVEPAAAGTDQRLAIQVRNALVGAGVPPANYVGNEGLDERDDLAGLNLSTQPSVLVELGNMRSAEEAARLESPAYQARLAGAIDSGIRRFLGTG